MKCFIIDSYFGLFGLNESGSIVSFRDFDNDTQKIIDFYVGLEIGNIPLEYEEFIKELQDSGFNEFIFDNDKLKIITSEKLGCITKFDKTSLEFRNFRLNLEEQLTKIGIIKTSKEISSIYKRINEKLIKKSVSEAGGQGDAIVIQIIETLDILKKTISLFSGRLREWYGLHFPELTDKIIEENILLAKLVSTVGNRENYIITNLKEEFSFSEELLNLLIKKASQSMGANIELSVVQGYANQILSLDSYRGELEEFLEDLMEKTAPNLKAIVSSLIGAKLIAKAGGLKKLAFMPASRIQLLGAEKALYRFLKTGEKRPKHGLIFQWRQVRSSKYYLRGKISRILAGKVGIASKIDYFNGEFIGDVLAKEVEDKIKEIEVKYPNPPKKKVESKKPFKKGKKQKRKNGKK